MSTPSIGYYLQISGSNYVITDASGSTVGTYTNALAAINQLITLSSNSLLGGYIRTGTYPTSSPVVMKSNSYIRTQNNVVISHTGNATIIDFTNVSKSTIYAEGNFEVLGQGAAGYDFENGIVFTGDNDQITLDAANYEGFKVHRIGRFPLWSQMNVGIGHITNSLFRNIYAYDWVRHGLYPDGGVGFDGISSSSIINMHSDGMDRTNARSALVIGGWNAPSSDLVIEGGVFERAYADNGVYLGGWNFPVHHVQINNITTSGNNKAGTAHSGLKIRPACYVTVRGWHSIGDYQGCEMGTAYDNEASTYLTGGSWYNSIQGIIDNPTNVGLIVGTDGSNKGQSCQHNEFDVVVNNAGKSSLWWYNASNNIAVVTSNGANREAISLTGPVDNNTFYGIFANNGKQGYPDLQTAGSGNIFNVVSTTGNPNGLGAPAVYPYTGSVPYLSGGANPTLTIHSTPEGIPFFVRKVA